MKKRALFVGRFQPLHNGHIDALRQILEHPENFDEVIIAIGSAENDFLPENPLTAGERCEMWARALEENNIPREKTWILPIRNIERYSLWPHHVQKLCPPFAAVFSGSPLVRLLWSEAFPGKEGLKILELAKHLPVSGTLVRQKMANENSVTDLLPKSTGEFLAEIGARERMQAETA